MPQTKFEKLFFMALTVLVSVTAFTVYNVAIAMGSMSNRVFLLAAREIPVEFTVAFILESAIVYKAAERMAFRFVDPRTDRPMVVILGITAMTICLMCPAMSFVATILYNGINCEIISNWLQKMVYNLPFAFFTQIFIIGPFVRFVFRAAFRSEAALETEG
ncbi:DUF2798 domain-containing protein [Holophaga foetida]|uniref:DUF2798 domain-containing protein n=1 Tax=Holophaga foetida TaxID=35839 RepID=UPI00024717E0|nr:DUF2798 domain-containing protein [Holophaga foetida]